MPIVRGAIGRVSVNDLLSDPLEQMSWTRPINWAAGELITAAQMNREAPEMVRVVIPPRTMVATSGDFHVDDWVAEARFSAERDRRDREAMKAIDPILLGDTRSRLVRIR